MRKFLLFLLLAGCGIGPSFKLGDKVKISSGFYAGCVGDIIEEDWNSTNVFERYVVQLYYCPGLEFIREYKYMKSIELEKITTEN